MRKNRFFASLCSALFVLASGTLLSALFTHVEGASGQPPRLFATGIHDLAHRFHIREVLRGKTRHRNAALSYRRAASKLIRDDEEALVARLEQGETPDLEARRVWLGVNRKALSEIRRGTQCLGSVLLLDPFQGFDAQAPEVGLGPPLCALAVASGLAVEQEGRPLEALRTLLDAARFGQDLARGGGVVHRLFSARIEATALVWFLRVMGRADLDAAGLRALGGEIRIFAEGAHPLAETLDMEAALLLGELARRREDRGRATAPAGPSLAGDAAREAGRAVLAWTARAREAVSREERMTPSEATRFMMEEASSFPRALPNAMPDVAELVEAERTVETLRRAARIAVALVTYRKAWSAYPERLDEINGRVLQRLPADPFSGRPFAYRRTPDGEARFWSAGPDEDDDGGRPLAIGTFEEADGDWVFVLR